MQPSYPRRSADAATSSRLVKRDCVSEMFRNVGRSAFAKYIWTPEMRATVCEYTPGRVCRYILLKNEPPQKGIYSWNDILCSKRDPARSATRSPSLRTMKITALARKRVLDLYANKHRVHKYSRNIGRCGVSSLDWPLRIGYLDLGEYSSSLFIYLSSCVRMLFICTQLHRLIDTLFVKITC